VRIRKSSIVAPVPEKPEMQNLEEDCRRIGMHNRQSVETIGRAITKCLIAAALLGGTLWGAERKNEPKRIGEAELVRRTQELFDAIVPGDQKPWKEYYADDCIFADEKGRKFGKTELVADITGLPTGYSGAIKVTSVESRIIGNIAVLSYDLDESETIFGQQLKARYHEIDTWMYRDGRWQILASQAHRYYEDPSPAEIDPKLLDLYVGTYELAPGVTMEITREDDELFAQRTGRPREKMIPEAAGIFFRKGVEGRRLFHSAADGTVDKLIDRRNNEDVIWKRVR
jgi:hypothetical protein